MLKSRKRMLLSSIAMLLVALVALGSATFAWFTQNKSVSASGFAGKASSSLGLKIISESEAASDTTLYSLSDIGTWKQTTTLNTGGTTRTFTPVSMVPAAVPSAFTTTAQSETNGARDTANAEVKAATAATAWNNGDYYMEKIYVGLSGDASGNSTGVFDIDNLTAAIHQTASMAPGVRFFVYYKNASGNQVLVGKYASAATDTDEITATAAKTVASTTTSVHYDAVPSANTKISNNDYTVNSVAGDCYFTVVAFLDGQDPAVKTQYITTLTLVQNIQLALTLK